MNKLHILIVDDEIDFANTLASRLEIRSFKTFTVYSGEEALNFLKKEKIDVIILDLKMPGIDGIETLSQIKKIYPNIHIIILTAHGSEKNRDEAKKLGAFNFLQKPVSLELLVDNIIEAYNKSLSNNLSYYERRQ